MIGIRLNKRKIKKIFSYMPYRLQRFLVFPYACIVTRKSRSMDKEMLKDVEIDLSMKHSFEKFKGLLDYAYEHVPYYRRIWNEMGISPEDILTFEDIKKLPIIDKRTVLENYNEFISDEVDINDLVQHSTGGSSGVTLTVLYDQNTVRARRLGILRWMNFAGLKPSDKGVWIGRASESLLQDRTMWGGMERSIMDFIIRSVIVCS